MRDRPQLHAPPPPGPESFRERPKKDEREKKEVPRGVAVVNFYITDPPEDE